MSQHNASEYSPTESDSLPHFFRGHSPDASLFCPPLDVLPGDGLQIEMATQSSSESMNIA